jgi:hypothetical protein
VTSWLLCLWCQPVWTKTCSVLDLARDF